MSAAILDQLLPYIRSQFTKQQVQTVEEYGGQFSGEELRQVSYSSPAIFVTVLGWKPGHNGDRLMGKHVREVSLAAFVTTKHVKRELRMRAAMQIADKLALALRLWVPDNTLATQGYTVGPLEDAPLCENLYGRAMDNEGQALWLLSWTQCIKPNVPLEQIYDLLAIDITDTVHQGMVVDSPAETPLPLAVTETIQFTALPPTF
jgi:hypothetical protein